MLFLTLKGPKSQLNVPLCTLSILLSIWCASSQVSQAPNIIFILADDLGWDDVGFHGSEIKTPNIDHLAKEGVMLNNYYVQPVCTPTRSAILTGKYPIHTGLQHKVILASEPYGMPLNLATLPQLLKERGYKTHAIGKWHLGYCSDAYLPESRGFDSFLGFYNGHTDYFDHHLHYMDYAGYDFHYKKEALWNKSEIYSTEIFTEHAKSLILSHDKSTPLFIYMAHQAVHAADYDVIQAPQKYINRFGYITDIKRKYFAGAVSALDDSVGIVYKSLVEAGMMNNTIVVFSTDNGGPTNGRDGNAACNWPLRGCKGTLWQGGVRGVGFVHSPLLERKGYVNHNLIHVTDWLPTLLSVSNQQASYSKSVLNVTNQIDGTNQWDVISLNKTTKRREALLNIDPIQRNGALIVGDFKLIHGDISSGKYDGWYPPPPHRKTPPRSSLDDGCKDSACKVYKNEAVIKKKMLYLSGLEKMKNKNFGNENRKQLDDMIFWMNKQYDLLKQKLHSKPLYADSSELLLPSEKNLKDSLLNTKSDSNSNSNVVVHCGPKPADASFNCKPNKEPCLYNIRTDPCEYTNLASHMPDVVKELHKRLKLYRKHMVAPANKMPDPKGNPQLHGGVFVPWL